MEFNQEYDFVILGEHPAGLWAAQHLLNLGKKVLIIPMGTYHGLNALPQSVAGAFQIPESNHVNREVNPIQIVTGGRRVVIPTSLAAFQEEIHFNYGAPLKNGEAPKPDLLRGLAYLARGTEGGPVFPDDWAFIGQKLFETVYFEKEKNWVIHTLIQSLKNLGATIAPLKSLKQIFLDRKALVGVQLAGTSKMIPVKAALLNAQIDLLSPFFNEPFPMKSLPISWSFEIRFECGIDFLPLGLTTKLIYVEREAPILDISHESPGHFRIQTSLPLNPASLDRGEQRRLAERMLRVAENLLPDLSYNIKKVTPDLRDPERAMATELPSLYPFQELRKIPYELLNYGVGSDLGVQTPIQNVFITQDEAHPRFGLWGAYQAVVQALDVYSKREQKPEISKISL